MVKETHQTSNTRQFPGNRASKKSCERFDSYYDNIPNQHVKSDGEYVWVEEPTGNVGFFTNAEKLRGDTKTFREVLKQFLIDIEDYCSGYVFSVPLEREGELMEAFDAAGVDGIGFGAFSAVKILRYDTGELYTKQDMRKIRYH